MTRNRRQWIPQAIACYQAQTHPHRELLILADGADVQDLIPADPSIRLVVIEEGYRIGDKRNFGCELARGELIAHWDDDDYSAPSRLSDQIQRLMESGKAVTGYNRMRFKRSDSEWWEYRGTGGYAIGTSLLYRKSWWKDHPFPCLQVGEDGKFVEAAQEAKQITAVPADRLMYATIHANNTSPRNVGSGGPYYRVDA